MKNNFNRAIIPGVVSSVLVIITSCLFSTCINDEPTKIQSVSPLIGCRGGTLSIIGWGFSGKKDGNIVTINDVLAEVVEVYANMLVVTLPDTVMSGKILVKAGNNFASGPEYAITDPRYYVKFKLDGTQKYFETCDPPLKRNSSCVQGIVPLATNESHPPYAKISICDNSITNVTGSVMDSWRNNKISFAGSNLRASFELYDHGIRYNSDNLDAQEDSELIITDISQDAGVIYQDVYIATGTFKCKVRTESGGNDIAVSEGEFAVRFTESK